MQTCKVNQNWTRKSLLCKFLQHQTILSHLRRPSSKARIRVTQKCLKLKYAIAVVMLENFITMHTSKKWEKEKRGKRILWVEICSEKVCTNSKTLLCCVEAFTALSLHFVVLCKQWKNVFTIFHRTFSSFMFYFRHIIVELSCIFIKTREISTTYSKLLKIKFSKIYDAIQVSRVLRIFSSFLFSAEQ